MDIRTRQFLEKEKPVYEREIKALYRKLDREHGLSGASIPITFVYDEKVLGSYTPKGQNEREHFTFSLYFISFCNKDGMHRADKIDLYLHEYAHYMQYHLKDIPKEYLWQPGKHGSAWKYCCSLIGAAPTPYYRIGDGLIKHDYDQVLQNRLADKFFVEKDNRKREQEYRKKKESIVQYQVGETIQHPKYGSGTITDILTGEGYVRLKIQFAKEQKLIDQKWLLRTKYQSLNDRLKQ